MKKTLAICLLVTLLFGCASHSNEVDQAMILRQKILQADECTFDADITADYTDMLYSFSMQCRVDGQGNLSFTLTQPTSVSGITGLINNEGGALTFDNDVLAFNELAYGQISPVCAPWVFMNTLRGGYINACEKIDAGYRISIDDSYQEQCLQLDIWTDDALVPSSAEVSWQGRRVLTMQVNNFQIL